MATDISKLGLKTKWQDLTEGMIIAGAGTSAEFNTGEWSSIKPVFIEENCKQCLLLCSGMSQEQLHSGSGQEKSRI